MINIRPKKIFCKGDLYWFSKSLIVLIILSWLKSVFLKIIKTKFKIKPKEEGINRMNYN